MLQEGQFFDHLHDHIIHDRFLTSILTVYFTITAILFLLAGLAVWPVIFLLNSTETAVAGLCNTVLRANLPLLGVYLVITGLFLVFEHGYSFFKTSLINIAVGGVVNLAVLLSQRTAFLASPDFMLTLLWFILSFLLSWVLALLPSMLFSGAAKLIHSVFFTIFGWRHNGGEHTAV